MKLRHTGAASSQPVASRTRAQLGRRARRDAIHHRIRTGGVGLHPRQQFGVAHGVNELEQAAAKTLAVVTQVVAIEQRDRAGCG
jgi:hypothetical protein